MRFPKLREVSSAAFARPDQVKLRLEVDDVLRAAHILERPVLLSAGHLVREVGHHLYVVEALKAPSFGRDVLVEVRRREQLEALGALHP